MKAFKKIGISFAVLLIVGFVVILNQTNQSQETLKIGIMSPLSGEYAVAGQNYQKGIELALDEYRKENPDVDIQIVVEDDGFVVQKGLTAYKKLVDLDKVDAILMVSTPVIDAIHEDIKKTDLIVMQLGIQTVGVADDNIFQTSAAPDAPIAQFAKYIDTSYDFEKVAVIYDNTAGGQTFLNAFKGSYSKSFDEFVINKKEDIRPIALKISGNEYGAVVFLTSPEHGALTVKEIKAVDSTPPLFAFDAQLQTGFADYERILGDANILNGSISMWLKSGDAEKFKELYVKKYGEDPGFVADFGYDTFNMLMQGYSKDKKKWIDNIQNLKSEGASGKIAFDENNIRLQDIVINKVIDGKLVPIK